MTTDETLSYAFLFPGQGSQYVGMAAELQEFPAARQVLQEADDLLGFSLSGLMTDGPPEALDDTVNTQPALFVHALAALAALRARRPEVKPHFMAGHSLGQLTALTAAGALSFADGLRLVRLRGQLMKAAGEAAPGGMAAILGLSLEQVEAICAEASEAGTLVQVANDNCPGQVVISGAEAAVARAVELARTAGARRAVPLAVSIAAHSELMRPAQEAFNQALASVSFSAPQVPVIGNVAAAPLSTPEAIRADLSAQLTARVRWTESVAWMVGEGANVFVEVGAGKVLSGLVKRIARSAKIVQWRGLLT